MSSSSSRSTGAEIPHHHPPVPRARPQPPPTPVDLWSQIVADENQHHPNKINVVYGKRKPRNNQQHANQKQSDSTRPPRPSRVSFADPNKRVSWKRSLSTRGRTSIAVGLVYQPQPKKDKRKGRPAIPKGKHVKPPNFEKERLYFQEVDAFELLEESPSPKKVGTWMIGNMPEEAPIPSVCSRLEKWLHARRLNPRCGPSSTLSKLLGTPAANLQTIRECDFGSTDLRTPEQSGLSNFSEFRLIKTDEMKRRLFDTSLNESDINLQIGDKMLLAQNDQGCEDIEAAVKKISLASTSSSSVDGDHISPFSALLGTCEQSVPSILQDALLRYSFLMSHQRFDFFISSRSQKSRHLKSSILDLLQPFLLRSVLVVTNTATTTFGHPSQLTFVDSESVVKIGEGTYGEAFKVGNYVCKIVPFDGDFRVNGEIQKRAEELLEEVLLCLTLNQLKGKDGDSDNLCRTFIESIGFTVCQGPYNAALIQAWEDWDHKHGSENDHPREFPDNQCYLVFVQEHGGKDLESFVLLNFDEARTLLVQVAAGLAVAESAYEFEHRDLHWGNILVSRSESVALQFTLDGKKMLVKTHGLIISIIDFTLSRINTGNRILYLDLSNDPDLFKGPKGDKQSETYRRMKKVTEDCWEGSYPKTNVLWLVYLVDILLMKKSFERSSKDERDLRSLKKRLDKYDSAKEAIFDPFFTDLFVESDPMA